MRASVFTAEIGPGLTDETLVAVVRSRGRDVAIAVIDSAIWGTSARDASDLLLDELVSIATTQVSSIAKGLKRFDDCGQCRSIRRFEVHH